jgi:hypothetical protein
VATTPPARALEALHAAGFDLAGASDAALERMEGARVARLLRDRRVHSIGLAPADDEVAVPAIAILLGQALAQASGRPTGLLDATGSWPGPRLLDAGDAAPGGSPLASCWLGDGLALLAPPAFDPGAMLAPLRDAVSLVPGSFEHLVVDLTGFDHRGELPAAMELLEGVLLVGRSGRTTGSQVRRWLGRAPAGRGLGVLLTGALPP